MLLNKRNLEIIKIAGTDGTRFVLSSLFIDVEAKKTVATDGYRLATVSLPEGVKDEDFPHVNGLAASLMTKNCILPKEGIEKLIKAIPKKTIFPILSHVAIDGAKSDADEKIAYIAVTDLESPQAFSIRKKEGAFPNYREIFPKGDPAVTISVNAKYLLEILQVAKDYGGDSCLVEIEVRDPAQPLMIRAKDRETSQVFEALVMPIRRKDPVPAPAQDEKSDAAAPETMDQGALEDVQPEQEHGNEQPEGSEMEMVVMGNEAEAFEEKEEDQQEMG